MRIEDKLKKRNIPHQSISGRGHCQGWTWGMSYRSGTYPTTRFGSLDNFYMSRWGPGEIVEDGDKSRWLVLVNHYEAGDASWPANHSFICIPESFAKEAQDLVKPESWNFSKARYVDWDERYRKRVEEGEPHWEYDKGSWALISSEGRILKREECP